MKQLAPKPPAATAEVEDEGTIQLKSRRRAAMKLLQFGSGLDLQIRPAYFGSFSQAPTNVGPRRPFAQEGIASKSLSGQPMDYDLDSEEEWEEPEEGESLGHSDGDDDDCNGEEVDKDEMDEDGFMVPDGYLSDDEGAEIAANAEDIVLGNNLDAPTEADIQFTRERMALNRQVEKLQHLFLDALHTARRKERPLVIARLDDKGEHKNSSEAKPAALLQAFPVITMIESSVEYIDSDEEEEREKALILQAKQAQTNDKKRAKEVAFDEEYLKPFLNFLVSKPFKGRKKAVKEFVTSMKAENEAAEVEKPSLSRSFVLKKFDEVCSEVDGFWQVNPEVLKQHGIEPPVQPTTPSTSTKPETKVSRKPSPSKYNILTFFQPKSRKSIDSDNKPHTDETPTRDPSTRQDVAKSTTLTPQATEEPTSRADINANNHIADSGQAMNIDSAAPATRDIPHAESDIEPATVTITDEEWAREMEAIQNGKDLVGDKLTNAFAVFGEERLSAMSRVPKKIYSRLMGIALESNEVYPYMLVRSKPMCKRFSFCTWHL